MKKTILYLICLLLINLVHGQNLNDELNFDTKFFNAIDKNVVFPKNKKDSTYAYGYIYIDQSAGLTFRYYGTFKLNEGTFNSIERKSENSMMIYRLGRNTSNVYILNESQIQTLELSNTPEWLEIYKSNEDTAEYMKDIGNSLNAVGGSQTALKYLEKAYTLEPHLDGLEFELAFAYNALKQFDKAVPVLENAIKNDSTNYLFYKELGYSYKFLGQVDKAEKTYKKGIKISSNDNIKSEMALNMTHTFFELKNREKFDEWSQLTRQYSKPGSQFSKYIDMFENDWDKK